MINAKIILVITVLFFLGCNDWKSNLGENLSPIKSEPIITPTPELINGQYIKKEGWEVPSQKQKQSIHSNSSKAKTSEGETVKVIVDLYVPTDDLITNEPFESIGKKEFGVIKIENFTELKVNNKVFCYILMAHRTKTHPDTGKLISIGPGFYFRYMDMDGDSKFETLIIAGKTDVPNWVTK